MVAGWRVLMIEDDSSVAELYASKLRRGGYDVDVARDGVDIHLPRLSGLAALASGMRPVFPHDQCPLGLA
jgi:CheY-like chemotaxis protein